MCLSVLTVTSTAESESFAEGVSAELHDRLGCKVLTLGIGVSRVSPHSVFEPIYTHTKHIFPIGESVDANYLPSYSRVYAIGIVIAPPTSLPTCTPRMCLALRLKGCTTTAAHHFVGPVPF